MILSVSISNHSKVPIKVYGFFYIHDNIEDVMLIELKEDEHSVLGPKTFNIDKSKFYYKIFSIYVESDTLQPVHLDNFEDDCEQIKTLDVCVKSRDSNLILEKNVFSSTTTKLSCF
jgi:hypothetical protein